MGISVRSNVLSGRVLRYLEASSLRLSSSFARLSSGARINRASDDAAGLAIADTLRARSRVYNQGIRNANDGISLLNIAQGAVGELTGVATRLKELAEQAANGTYSTQQRVALDGEARQLVLEMNRILGSTKFNGLNLLNNSLLSVRIQTDFGDEGGIEFGITRAIARNQGTGFGDVALSNSVLTDGEPIVTDLDGDGIVDQVYVDESESGVKVRYGTGGGSFASEVAYASAAPFGGTLGAGDVDGDGDIDLFHSSLGTTYILRNNGGRTFAGSQTLATGNVNAYAVGDVNGDGRPDLVSGSGSAVRVFLGQSNGLFSTSTNYTLGGTVRDLKVEDIDGDGREDIISGANGAGGGVYVLRGTASGALTSTKVSDTLARSIDIADVNRDGKLDIAIGSTGTGSILSNNGGLAFSQGQTFTFAGGGATFVRFGDMNSDGEIDLVAQSDGFIQSYTGNGSGTFSTFSSATTSGAGAGFAIGDLNDDGVDDIFLSDGNYRARFSTTQSVTTVAHLELTSESGALSALDAVSDLLDALTMAQGDIGSSQARIQVAIANLATGALNFDAAEGRIRDTDVASEAAVLAKESILQSVSAGLLAQANQFPALALQLLS